MEIQFSEVTADIKKVIQWGIEEFKKEDPNGSIYTLGIYVSPVFGYLNAAIDTKDSSDDFIDSFDSSESTVGYVAEDDHGSFNCNCPDFEYFYESEIELKTLSQAYKDHQTITLSYKEKSYSYSKATGDEGYNQAAHSALKDYFQELEAEGFFRALEITQARVGFQMFNSSLSYFKFIE